MHFGFWLDELLQHCLTSPPPQLHEATCELLSETSDAAKFLAFERGGGLPKLFFVFDQKLGFVIIEGFCLGFERSGRKIGGLIGLCQLGRRLATVDAGGALAIWEVEDRFIPSRIEPTMQLGRDIQSIVPCGADRLLISSLSGVFMLQVTAPSNAENVGATHESADTHEFLEAFGKAHDDWVKSGRQVELTSDYSDSDAERVHLNWVHVHAINTAKLKLLFAAAEKRNVTDIDLAIAAGASSLEICNARGRYGRRA